MDQCAIPDCTEPRLARGWCSAHYQRWLNHGDPLAGGRTPAKPGEPLAFYMAHVDLDTDDCIIWPYALHPGGFNRPDYGYGILHLDGRNYRVHALACERHHGPRPPGMIATHAPVICHTPMCFNGRRHLAWDTRKANMAHRRLDGTWSSRPNR